MQPRSELGQPPKRRPRPARVHPSPASYPGPTGPALRANPFPEVTDPICRLPLPTLFYRLEAVHLGDLLRIWVRPGTKFTLSPWDFQGPTRTHRTSQEPRCFTEPRSLSPGKLILGIELLTKKKENYSRDSQQRLSLSLRNRTLSLRTSLRVKVQEINPIPFQ